MKKLTLIGLFLSGAMALALNPVHAKDASAAETTGVAVGAVVGVAAGGPIGALVGTLLGQYVGKKAHDANRVDDVEGALAAANIDIARLHNELEQGGVELRTYKSMLEQQPDLDSVALEFEVLFATDESQLSDENRQRLEKLATLMREIPGLKVQIDGYADQRGDETYNQQLSAKRAEEVETFLGARGVVGDRIETFAHGERLSRAGDGDIDAYALERKVTLRIFSEGTPRIASN